MAVPKKRTGKSAQAKRRANWKAVVPATTKCSSCGAIIPTHTVCPECGSYKGKVVSIKHENYVSGDEQSRAKAKQMNDATDKKSEALAVEDTTENKVEESPENNTAE